MKNLTYLCILFVGLNIFTNITVAQIVSPPSGDNQKSSVTQNMGLVEVKINYNSPNVHTDNNEDRTGHIWGELVPFGFANLGFGQSTDASPSPWRAGANENTTFTFSHDVLIEGKKLKAGTYGFFIAPGEGSKPWTIIFSNNATAWGSFFYSQNEDALRVYVIPTKNPFHEWLTFEFIDRQPNTCTVALDWENLSIPIKIAVENNTELYIDKIRQQLQNTEGFNYLSFISAANFCVQNNTNLEEALTWANYALSGLYVGNKDFASLSCKASVLNALGRNEEGNVLMKEAINSPTASIMDIHNYARGLQAEKNYTGALEAFQLNAKKFPNQWPVNLGLARGYSSVGEYKNALKYAKIALTQAPDSQGKSTCELAIKKLELKQDFN